MISRVSSGEYLTVGSMYSAKNSGIYKKNTGPMFSVLVPDALRPEAGINYVIKQHPETRRFSLYFGEDEVPSPEAVFAIHRQTFLQQLATLDAPVANRVLTDLGLRKRIGRPVVTAAYTLTDRTPRPQYTETKTPKLLDSPSSVKEISIEEKLTEAVAQIRLLVDANQLPVYSLSDGSGYYTNIVDNRTGQVHQVGYSSSLRNPWHIVFQLDTGVDSVHGSYEIPSPQVQRRNLVLSYSPSKMHMRQVYAKNFNENNEGFSNEGSLAKLVIRDALGKLPRQHRHDPPPARFFGRSDPPTNIRTYYPEQPAWLRKAVKEIREEEAQAAVAYARTHANTGRAQRFTHQQIWPVVRHSENGDYQHVQAHDVSISRPRRSRPLHDGNYSLTPGGIEDEVQFRAYIAEATRVSGLGHLRTQSLIQPSALPIWMQETYGTTEFPKLDSSKLDAYGFPMYHYYSTSFRVHDMNASMGRSDDTKHSQQEVEVPSRKRSTPPQGFAFSPRGYMAHL